MECCATGFRKFISSTCSSLNRRRWELIPDSNSDSNEPRVYKTRFWILIVFSLMACLQSFEWNTWGPISESTIATLPGWSSSTVAMMGNWGTITFVLFILPVMYFTAVLGLKNSALLSGFLIVFGTTVRYFTFGTRFFTIACHICAITVGSAGTIVLAVPPLIASTWFPYSERTTATAFCQAFVQLGSVMSYLQPLIVRSPEGNTPAADILSDINRLISYGFSTSLPLLLCIIFAFPAKPHSPPSLTSTVERTEYIPSLKFLFRNKAFLLTLISYGIFLGFPGAWMAVLNFSFLEFGIQQDEAMLIGILALSCSCVSVLSIGRFTDRFFGHMKKTLLFLTVVCFGSFLWFLLLSVNVLPVTKWQIYTSVILGVSANFASSPLYFELGVEMAYPTPEGIVGGLLTAGNNFIGIIFLFLFFIPFTGYTWVTYCLVGSTVLSVIPLLLIKEEYPRSALDQQQINTSNVSADQNGSENNDQNGECFYQRIM